MTSSFCANLWLDDVDPIPWKRTSETPVKSPLAACRNETPWKRPWSCGSPGPPAASWTPSWPSTPSRWAWHSWYFSCNSLASSSSPLSQLFQLGTVLPTSPVASHYGLHPNQLGLEPLLVVKAASLNAQVNNIERASPFTWTVNTLVNIEKIDIWQLGQPNKVAKKTHLEF